jgi:hypothetical protein
VGQSIVGSLGLKKPLRIGRPVCGPEGGSPDSPHPQARPLWLVAVIHHPPYSKVWLPSVCRARKSCGGQRMRRAAGALLPPLQLWEPRWVRGWCMGCWHPPSQGSEDSDHHGNQRRSRALLLPMLELGGVDLVLSGHSHSYERSLLVARHYGTNTSWDPSTMLLDGRLGSPATDAASPPPCSAGTPSVLARSSWRGGGGERSGAMAGVCSVPPWNGCRPCASLAADVPDACLSPFYHKPAGRAAFGGLVAVVAGSSSKLEAHRGLDHPAHRPFPDADGLHG